MRTLHLFAGAGGGILADLILGHTPVCAVEINRYCRHSLKERMSAGMLPKFPIYKDVKKFDGRVWRGKVDIVCGGFPCQPYSVAGKGEGEGDERNLWPDTLRIIGEVGCRFAFLENVPGLLSFDYFGRILGDLASCGFDAEWDVVSAASVGAWHLRERLWLFAFNPDCFNVNQVGASKEQQQATATGRSRNGQGTEKGDGADSIGSGTGHISKSVSGQVRQQTDSSESKTLRQDNGKSGTRWVDPIRADVPDAGGVGLQRVIEAGTEKRATVGGSGWWDAEPGMGRVAHGVANRNDRLKAIGNGQVPQAAAKAFILLAERAGILKFIHPEFGEQP